MTDLTNFRVTDFVTDVLAAQYNRVLDATLRGELANVETLSADKTLIDADFPTQVYATSAARIITLPAVAAANHSFFIVNTSVYKLTVKNAGGTVLEIIAAGGTAMLVSDAVAWRLLSPKPVDNGGWTEDLNTWTYASASTFTVPGDLTAIFTKGLRLRWKQGGAYKYGAVESSAYGAPNTTVTIIVNTDYTVANAAITENAISNLDNPRAWPGWFNYTAVVTGFSVDPTSMSSRYSINGNRCTVIHWEGASGTSNATTFTVSAPTPASASALSTVEEAAYVMDNGAAAAGSLRVNASGTVINVYKAALGAFTASGSKRASFTCFYEI